MNMNSQLDDLKRQILPEETTHEEKSEKAKKGHSSFEKLLQSIDPMESSQRVGNAMLQLQNEISKDLVQLLQLDKANFTALRRARINSIKLEKLYRDFRKLTIELEKKLVKKKPKKKEA